MKAIFFYGSLILAAMVTWTVMLTALIIAFTPAIPVMFLAMPAFLSGKWRWMARPYLTYHRFIVEKIGRQKVDPYWKAWSYYQA
jgi:hypothetical protein